MTVLHRNWLSDQSYTGGYGDEFRGKGPVTNDYQHPNPFARCRAHCQEHKNPWAAPGLAPSLGGGCGVSGGNPYGCPKGPAVTRSLPWAEVPEGHGPKGPTRG